ncbi:hypothetical protein O3I_005810 [Nocardia brasiliensis ATCC 700358]|uniref:Uncharacterized protein n=1 Tax=Nocardia brasiliensis (strain ATCC 700358 / HUJEG-1) TaxID=1133849 RepID=K0EQN1_NOCB7|nr:hypothetical protein O3I_005810 [Nocardia brasiliensis ATCC 700358]
MWGWSTTIAEHAAAGAFTRWPVTEPEPTIVDPDFRTEAEQGEDAPAEQAARAPSCGYDLVG